MVRTAPFVYVRFHGRGGIGAGRYRSAELRRWAERLRELSAEGTTYVYFNNDQAGYAVEKATRLIDLLRE
jgi:uncharacterized protein YecE (DUF72 family)